MRTKISDISFLDFVEVWNDTQGLKTPDVHRKIINFLSKTWNNGNEKALLMAFRGCGKSTMVGLFCAWLLMQNPNLRILVLSAQSELASRMVRTVKRIIERHSMTSRLKPKKAEQWAHDCFTVERSMQLREASMQAEGIMGNITGARADVIVCDDVEVPNTSATAMKREGLRSRLNEVDYILVPSGLQLYVGTPHTFYSIYSKEKQGDTLPFLSSFKRKEIPIINSKGLSEWEERFPIASIDALKLRHGRQKFNAQMQLQCINPSESRLDSTKIITYDKPLHAYSANGIYNLEIDSLKMHSVSAVWDPAYGLDRGDKSVIACVFTGADAKYYLHDLKIMAIDITSEVDTARQQCLQVVDFVVKNNLPSVHIEKNGIGQFLPSLLKSILAERNVGVAVVEYHSSDSKNSRIVQSFDAILDAGHLIVHDRVVQKGFLEQLADFNPIYKNNKDDMIDAVARCLTFEPVRLNTVNMGARSGNWSRGGVSANGQKDFEIW